MRTRWGYVVGSSAAAALGIAGCVFDGTSTGGHVVPTDAGATSDGGFGGGDDDAGVGREPPTVTNVGPLAGDYGTLVTIDGDNLGTSDVRVELETTEGAIVLTKSQVQAPVSGEIVVKWDKTQIQFKYPFPAEGQIRVTNGEVEIDGGKFAPSWRPGASVSGTFLKTDVLGVVAPAPGKLVTVFDGPSTGAYFVVADGTSITPVAYDRGATALRHASVYTANNGDVEGFYASPDAHLWQMKLAGTTATTTDTGVQITAVEPFVAGGTDANGAYAWIRTANVQISRVHAPSWAVDKGPIAEPPNGTSIVEGAVAPDGSLVMAWEHDEESFLGDKYVLPYAATLAPGGTGFGSSVVVGPQADDYSLWLRVRGAGPSHQLATFYCAKDTDTLGNTIGTDCKEGYVGPLGTVEPLPATMSDRTVGWNAAVSVAMVCDKATNTLKVGPADDAAKQVTALYPCPPEVSIAADPTGAAVMLVSTGSHIYSPRKR